MPTQHPSLSELGWRKFFSTQLSPEEQASLAPVRVMAVYRGQVAVAGADVDRLIPSHISGAASEEDHATVGDWLLIDLETLQIARILTRASLFLRRAPGNARRVQLIAANVDTLFIVASCNEDFNIARLERYLVLAHEVGVTPVLVLTKADLTDTPEAYVAAARGLQSDLRVEIVNAKDPASVARLAAWCGPGQTVSLMGSSGVGKSTLINTLRGSQSIVTQAVREADGKGRHTTTVREMHRLPEGGWLMDARAAALGGRGGAGGSVRRHRRAGAGMPFLQLHPCERAGLRGAPRAGKRQARSRAAGALAQAERRGCRWCGPAEAAIPLKTRAQISALSQRHQQVRGA